MIILAADTSSRCCSAAVYKNSVISAEVCVNNGLVHSQTFMPMVEQVLLASGVTPAQVDAFACVNGPGSFTGVRIAVSAIKALAQPLGKPCVAVNSLEAAALNVHDTVLPVVPLLDARCGQVYAAVYKNGSELLPSAPIALSELISFVKPLGPVIFTGDGLPVHKQSIINALGSAALFAPEHLSYARAGAAAVIAARKVCNNQAVSCFELDALYLRKPQAEREYDERHNG